MKITTIDAKVHAFDLKRPYKIAYKTTSKVNNVIVEIKTDQGHIGLGCGAPSFEVTKETIEQCLHALDPNHLDWCIGRDLTEFPLLKRLNATKLAQTPAACAALDIALHDLYGQLLGVPVVDLYGRVHQQLPTSITIGIKNVEDTLNEAKEYIERGFFVLKVKLGNNFEEDLERLRKLREHYPTNIIIRVDPNQGYSIMQLLAFMEQTQALNIEFIEQPIKVADLSSLYDLSDQQKQLIAIDEALLTPKDAIRLLQPKPCCGIFNIKLMKCGGLFKALEIATIAENANINLMWGCNDESIISITAALHAALSSPATRYLDLDGSLDLAQDVVQGGFSITKGIMTILNKPGLGVAKI